jgi:nitric oxide reductase large subunit
VHLLLRCNNFKVNTFIHYWHQICLPPGTLGVFWWIYFRILERLFLQRIEFFSTKGTKKPIKHWKGQQMLQRPYQRPGSQRMKNQGFFFIILWLFDVKNEGNLVSWCFKVIIARKAALDRKTKFQRSKT